MFRKLNKEEQWNSITHAFGILFALIAFPILLYKNAALSAGEITGLSVYFFSFIFLFIASTAYHLSVNEDRKRLWRKIDHISIYFMISGTYVPFMIKYIELNKAILFLSIMYSLVLAGSILKIFFTGKFEKASLFLYLFLGWMIIFIAPSFFSAASWTVIALVASGGLAYTLGVLFYTKDHRRYFHAIWHIFVLVGSILHFQGVYLL